MRKIAVVTGTRAEYGLLYHTIKEIQEDEDLELQLIVTGTHLSKLYGYTALDIEKDGIEIAQRINIITGSEDEASTVTSMAILQEHLAKAFLKLKPEVLLILGDRYEVFAAAGVAMAMNIPIAHISGGEITEGAQDEVIRHAITKLSHLHFPGADYYAQNIRKMGEEPWRIFNVGDPGIENIKKLEFLSSEEIERDLNLSVDDQTLLITFHPVTLELDALKYQVDNLLKALDTLDRKSIITYPNADTGGRYIIDRLKSFAKDRENIYLFKSLGIKRYLSVMKLCGAVVGNSSSSIVEAPYLKVPAVDIGTRQKGRLKAGSIIECGYEKEEIISAVELALSKEFKQKCTSVESLYGYGNTSKEIVSTLKTTGNNEKLLKKKLIWS